MAKGAAGGGWGDTLSRVNFDEVLSTRRPIASRLLSLLYFNEANASSHEPSFNLYINIPCWSSGCGRLWWSPVMLAGTLYTVVKSKFLLFILYRSWSCLGCPQPTYQPARHWRSWSDQRAGLTFAADVRRLHFRGGTGWENYVHIGNGVGSFRAQSSKYIYMWLLDILKFWVDFNDTLFVAFIRKIFCIQSAFILPSNCTQYLVTILLRKYEYTFSTPIISNYIWSPVDLRLTIFFVISLLFLFLEDLD